MSFEGVKIDKLNGGLGRTSSAADRVIALVYGFDVKDYAEFSFKIANYAETGFYTIEDVEAAGIKDLYTGVTYEKTTEPDPADATKTVVKYTADEKTAYALKLAQLWYHFDEMFRLAPGQKFYLITVPTTALVIKESGSQYDALLDDAKFISAIRRIDDINVLAFANITDLTLQNIVLHGDENSKVSYATIFQEFVKTFSDDHLLIDGVFLEGRYDKASGATAVSLTDTDDANLCTSTVNAPNVSVVVAQDPAMSGLQSPIAIGTVLGSVAIRKIHEDLGSVDIEEKPSARKGEENYTITDSSTGRWSNATLCDGTKFLDLVVSKQAAISSNGYIYVGSFKNYGGFFLSGCQTAVQPTSDYAFFNFNCVWNKAARLIRTSLIPRVRSNVPVDSSTGYIKSTTISYWTGIISKQLETMVAAGNISGFDVYIDPKQKPSIDTSLYIKTRLVTNRIVHEFEVELGLTDKLD